MKNTAYKRALTQLRRAQRLQDDFRLQAQLAATILGGNSEMLPRDAVDLAYLILSEIAEQQVPYVKAQAQMLAKQKGKRHDIDQRRVFSQSRG